MAEPAGEGNFIENLMNWAYFIIMTVVMCGSFYLQGRKDENKEVRLKRKLKRIIKLGDIENV